MLSCVLRTDGLRSTHLTRIDIWSGNPSGNSVESVKSVKPQSALNNIMLRKIYEEQKLRQKMLLKRSIIFRLTINTAFGLIFLFFVCEYLIYYFVIFQCNWPELNNAKRDPNIRIDNENESEPLKVMLLADTHLLGSRKGHWLDKLRREWQMYRSFQTANYLLKPEIIFFLGDLFDEGLWCSKDEFQYYVKRFHSLFHVEPKQKVYVVPGNHDMGFHYGISPYLNERFTSAFNSPTVRFLTIRGNHFILINSMALEGDGCFLCRPAEVQLSNIEKSLKCAKNSTQKCARLVQKINSYSHPIILQHYPLFRESDAKRCEKIDLGIAAEPDFSHVMAERYDCLSREATWTLLNNLFPRLAIGGHTHNSCYRHHINAQGFVTEEYSIPSFSWRNKPIPAFLLVLITPNNYAVNMCYLPYEVNVYMMWFVGLIVLAVYNYYCIRTKFRNLKLKT